MLDIIPKNKLLKSVELSPDIKKRAEGYIVIMKYGLRYYIPITKELKKIFKISRRGKKFLFPSWSAEHRAERHFRDFIMVMYLQVRQDVGAEIQRHLSQELKDGFEKLFDPFIENKIEQGFKKQQLTWDKK